MLEHIPFPDTIATRKAVSYILHKVSLFAVSSQAGFLPSERGSPEVSDQHI